MASWSRKEALMTMTSPLGPDELVPIGLSGREAINEPFRFQVDAICQLGDIDANKLLNHAVCVTLQSEGEAVRYFHGIVQSVTKGDTIRGQAQTNAHTVYHLVLVPKLWFLSQTTDCRVYEAKSAADILKAMFQDAGLTDFSGPPSAPSRDYTVQFNETDLHFATRLMEEEGWFYYFKHEANKHTLVIANENEGFQQIEHGTLYIGGSSGVGHAEALEFSETDATVHGKWKLKDYNPQKPADTLEAEEPTTLGTGGASTRDAFRFPAYTFQSSQVKDRAEWEIQASEAMAKLFDGTTHFAGMVAGGIFSLSSRPASSFDRSYVARSVSHHARDETWINQSSPATYSCRFQCFPKATKWRQPMVTRRPRMDGVHTGLVLGPKDSSGSEPKMQNGEEIHSDDLARIRVRLFWDHRKEATGGGAVWARVVQLWAGDGWGSQFVPRVGTEVAVAFVDGDPDRPMILGGLYNGISEPIYPANSTKIGFRTRSSMSGSKGSNFSEFTIDDKKGDELIYFHAEKDYTTEIEHDQTLTVDNCRMVTVKKDETVDIKGKQTITVTEDRKVTVTDGNETDNVQKGNYSLTVDQGDISVEASLGAISVDAMKTISIESKKEIVMKVGQSSITIDQKGITLEAMMITITGQAKADIGSPMTTVKADGILTLKGSMTMIN